MPKGYSEVINLSTDSAMAKQKKGKMTNNVYTKYCTEN